MSDKDPFGYDDPDALVSTDDDEKTVRFTDHTGAPVAPAPDDGATTRYDRNPGTEPAEPEPAEPEPDEPEPDDEMTVRHQRGPAPATAPPPVWHTTGARTAEPGSTPGGPVPGGYRPGGTPAWFPGTPQAPSGRSGIDRRWWFIGGVAAAVLLVIALVAVVAAGSGDDATTASPTSSPPSTRAEPAPETPAETPSETTTAPPAVAGAGELAGLLEPVAALSTRMDGPELVAGPVAADLASGPTVTPANCSGAWTPADGTAYAASGYTGVAAQTVGSAAPGGPEVVQAVVSFPDDQAATTFYDTQVAAWKECAFDTITVTGSETVTGKSAASGAADGTLTMLIFQRTPDGGDGPQCQRALTVRTNLIVDVRACSPSVGSAGWTIARDIGQKITGRR